MAGVVLKKPCRYGNAHGTMVTVREKAHGEPSSNPG